MLYDQLDRNRWMTALMFGGFALLVLVVSVAIEAVVTGGNVSAASGIIATVIAVVAILIAWFQADRIILSSLGAREPNPDVAEERRIVDLVENLAIAAQVPAPKVYIIDDPAPNAFATGRSPEKGVTAFTTGLLQKMNRQQTEAVAAHELSHIVNRDALVGVVAAVLVGVVLIVCRLLLRVLIFGGGRRRGGGGGGHPAIMILGIVVIVLAPIFAMLLRFAVSRRRETLADLNAVKLTRNPDAMIGALEVLNGDETQVDFGHGLASHLWIEGPEHERGSWLDRLTATHPPIPERIEALRAVAGDMRFR
ncbi:zinc metalloprotease HtpX [Egibacter rhizosphaerae]|uniref:Protease HtpX homolog n=1 Tax=Egibacter rhizosphaerae TaxID=1670831 RepID=A0A411YAU7_9ACTN|nr:M48 family metallopeptidase [Egibacter rhizosphaerae]QBI18302.1 zinc metalloprotease HtpX [Egibacter rhizosphaerae]